MVQTTARIKKAGNHFEILVDLEKALAFKKGSGNVEDFLEIDSVFKDSKKGERASENDLKESFGTLELNEIVSRIVKEGEILLTHEHRTEEQEKKLKQIIDFIVRNAIDPKTGNPHTTERIKNAFEQAHINIKNTPVDSQIKDILSEISKIIPIKIQTKKVKITVPAIHTGKAYGIFSDLKEGEKWLDNGDLEVIVNVPSGMLMDFYDKLNSVTHGSAITEEIKE
jgi:ribosome maturation protein SDO1